MRDTHGRQCGAFARTTGQPCRAVALLKGQRCALHGGKSTGARTEEGRARIIESNQRRKGEKRAKYIRRPKPAALPTTREIWAARRAEAAAAPSFLDEIAQSPESITFWRELIIAERRAIGWPAPASADAPAREPREIRRLRGPITIEAVRRRRLWLDGHYELLEAAP